MTCDKYPAGRNKETQTFPTLSYLSVFVSLLVNLFFLFFKKIIQGAMFIFAYTIRILMNIKFLRVIGYCILKFLKLFLSRGPL